jgi:hypothetical protein
MDKEQSVVNCKGCGETKIRFLVGTYPSKKNKKWVDENNIEWNGKMCPVCHKSRVAQRIRLKRKNSYI